MEVPRDEVDGAEEEAAEAEADDDGVQVEGCGAQGCEAHGEAVRRGEDVIRHHTHGYSVQPELLHHQRAHVRSCRQLGDLGPRQEVRSVDVRGHHDVLRFVPQQDVGCDRTSRDSEDGDFE